VAVLTYLRRILESLDHPDMINLILHYLLALPNTISPEASFSSTSTSVSAARKRKSMDLATMMAQKSDLMATPLLFNLVDLILACVKSHNQQTIYVTLQLVSAILKRHHRYAVITLLRTEGVHLETARRTVGAHEQEIEFIMTLASSIGGQDNFDEIYDGILKDSMTRLESHPCFLKLAAPKVSTNNHELPAIPDSLPGAPRDVRLHTLRPDDPLLSAILDVLETFFVNPVETNLSVTDAIIDLANCGYMQVEGWLLRNPQKYNYADDAAATLSPNAVVAPSGREIPPAPDSPSFAESEKFQAMEKCKQRPTWDPSALPRLLRVLEQLCSQVELYRGSVPRFDELLQQRREAFQTADSAMMTPVPPRKGTPHQHSSAHTPERPSLDEGPRSRSPARPSAFEGFAQRLFSELSSPSRSGSPKGRKDLSKGSSSNSASGLSGGYGLATPTSGARPVPIPPKEFPLNYDTPSRGGFARSYSPSNASAGASARDEASASFGSRDNTVASQAAAFAAIDQSILARRLGLPGKMEAIPLSFEKKPVPNVPDKTEGSVSFKADGDGSGEDVTPVPTPQERTATVSHVLTNVIILQSFLFELASLMQVRAGLFNEVRFA
jgi:hypothetical protein